MNVPHMAPEAAGMLMHFVSWSWSESESGSAACVIRCCGGSVRCKTGRPRQREGPGELEKRAAVRGRDVFAVVL